MFHAADIADGLVFFDVGVGCFGAVGSSKQSARRSSFGRVSGVVEEVDRDERLAFEHLQARAA
ncbi:MAG: hypothetical protein AAF235_05880, partial [Planctomycetota bacterium]